METPIKCLIWSPKVGDEQVSCALLQMGFNIWLMYFSFRSPALDKTLGGSSGHWSPAGYVQPESIQLNHHNTHCTRPSLCFKMVVLIWNELQSTSQWVDLIGQMSCLIKTITCISFTTRVFRNSEACIVTQTLDNSKYFRGPPSSLSQYMSQKLGFTISRDREALLLPAEDSWPLNNICFMFKFSC